LDQNDGENWRTSSQIHGSPEKNDEVSTDIIEIDNITAPKFSMDQNYPNPFNPVTTLKYSFSRGGHVSLTIFNMLGQEIESLVNREMQPGSYSISWDAQNLPSGVYFYKLTVDSRSKIKKMILLK